MRKLTATLCLTLCICFFATNVFAKTVHLKCYASKEGGNKPLAEISINFTTNKVVYNSLLVLGNPWTENAFITGTTISFSHTVLDRIFHTVLIEVH